MARQVISTDIVILGGSLSGSVAAITLAQQGIRSVLIDRVVFPRRKACGEGLATSVEPLLRKIGVWEQFSASRPMELYGFRIFDGTRLAAAVNHDSPVVWGIDRCTLDPMLRNAANASGFVHTLTTTKIQATERGEGIAIDCDDTSIQARFCILATGLGADEVKNAFGLHVVTAPKMRSGITYHIATRSRSNVVMIARYSEGELYLTPIAKNRVNVSFLLSGKYPSAWRDAQSRWMHIAALLPDFGITPALVESELGAAGFGKRVAFPSRGRVAAVGDALRSFDPIGGMGMTYALSTGVSAGEIIGDYLAGGISISEMHSRYAEATRSLTEACHGMTSLAEQFVRRFSRVPGIRHIANRLGTPLHRFAGRRVSRAVANLVSL